MIEQWFPNLFQLVICWTMGHLPWVHFRTTILNTVEGSRFLMSISWLPWLVSTALVWELLRGCAYLPLLKWNCIKPYCQTLLTKWVPVTAGTLKEARSSLRDPNWWSLLKMHFLKWVLCWLSFKDIKMRLFNDCLHAFNSSAYTIWPFLFILLIHSKLVLCHKLWLV